jgi:ABC-type glycerol-3-phosphate transport system substrate-binding protein
MKRIIVPIAATVAASLLVAACGEAPAKTSANGSGTVVVTVVSGDMAAWVKSAIPLFEKKYPSIKVVENTETQEQLLANATQLYSSNDAPDLAFLQTNMSAYPLLLKAGDLEPVDDAWSKDGLASAVPTDVSDGPWKQDGHYYGVVTDQTWAPDIFYNKALFAKAGISVPDGYRPTDQEFLGWIKKLKAIGAQGLAIGGDDFTAKHITGALAQAWTTSSAQWNEYVSNAATTSNDTPLYSKGPYLEALQTIDAWNAAGVFAKGSAGMTAAQAESLFASGNVGMLSDGPFDLPAIMSGNPPFDIGWMMYPTMSTGTKTPFLTYTGDGFAVPTHAKNPVGAKLLAEFLASPQGQSLLPAAGSIPIRSDLSTSLESDLLPQIREMMAMMPSLGTAPIWSPAQNVETEATNGFGELLTGQTTPDELATAVQEMVGSGQS